MKRWTVYPSVAAVCTAISGIAYLSGPTILAADRTRRLHGLLFAGWLVGAPAWFLIEWHWYGGKDKEYFKYSQSLAKDLWVALSVLLGLLFHFKGP